MVEGRGGGFVVQRERDLGGVSWDTMGFSWWFLRKGGRRENGDGAESQGSRVWVCAMGGGDVGEMVEGGY